VGTTRPNTHQRNSRTFENLIHHGQKSLAMSRYDLSDFEWSVIQSILPQKSSGVPRVNNRLVLNGIFWVLRNGAPWTDVPNRYGHHTTCYNRFRRWTKADVCYTVMDAIIAAYQGYARMIDGTCVRVHHSAITLKNATWTPLKTSSSRP